MKNFNIPFMEQTRVTNKLIPAYLFVLLIILLFRGLNYGIDFTGGTIYRIGFFETRTDAEIHQLLEDKRLGLPENAAIIVQDVENIDKLAIYKSEKLIHLPILSDDQKKGILASLKEKSADKPVSEHAIGPSVGEDMKKMAFSSIFFSVILVLIYMYYRFETNSAIGSILALIHDALFTVGMLSILRTEVNMNVVASVLTILGYSLNDSIVLLDRVRENRKIFRKLTFFELVNLSLNQTLTRTIYTSFTVLLAVLCLFFFGGEALRPLTITLLIGIVAGVFSTIYVVSAYCVYTEFKEEVSGAALSDGGGFDTDSQPV